MAKQFVTAFCIRVLAILLKELAIVGMQLILEVFTNSSLLI